MEVSLYNNTFDTNSTIIGVPKALELINSNAELEYKVSQLRLMSPEQYKEAKKVLPAVTWSGVFKQGTRSISTIEKYSGIVVIDIDKLDPSAITTIKESLFRDKYVFCVFISPSGTGLKVLVNVNTDPEHHRAAFLHLENYFLTVYGIKIDKSGKDVCRLCYLSYDPNILIKPQSDTFIVDMKYAEIVTEHIIDIGDYKATQEIDKIYKVCVKWVERNKSYVEGERNVYIHALACALNRTGVNMDEAISLMQANLPTPDQKWHQSVRSAYFHNQHEHGTIPVKDIGGSEFVAPPYITNFTDDVAGNDIMRITAMLYHYKVPNNDIFDVVNKISNYYHVQGYIDMRRANLVDMMNSAIAVLNQNVASAASQNKLEYSSAEDLGRELLNQDVVSGVVPTNIELFDRNMRGGMQPGNFYGLMGVGGTFKSIIAQYWAYNAATKDIPVLYLNGEMSMFQFYERMVMMAMSISLYYEISKDNLNKGNVEAFITQMKDITKNNLFFVNGAGFNEVNIMATCDHIFATTGKKIKFIVVDGVTQMDSKGKEEIPAAIMNTGVCKEIAKKVNGGEGAVVVGLMHISGDQASAKIRRDNGPFCRGGGKTIANMDGYFSTSMLIDGEAMVANENSEEMPYLPGKVYLRLVDKRSPAGVLSSIINVNSKNIHLEYEDTNPTNYEVKVERRR